MFSCFKSATSLQQVQDKGIRRYVFLPKGTILRSVELSSVNSSISRMKGMFSQLSTILIFIISANIADFTPFKVSILIDRI